MDGVIVRLHGDQGGEVSGVVGEEERAFVTVGRRAFQRKVDSAEGDWRQSFAVHVLRMEAIEILGN